MASLTTRCLATGSAQAPFLPALAPFVPAGRPVLVVAFLFKLCLQFLDLLL
jgi:hypothetical protein